MSTSPPPESPSRWGRLGLNPWLQGFLTIIAGAAVAVIAWTIIERFLHIIVLVLAGFLLAFLFGPLVDRLARRGMPRILAILLIYLVVLGGLVLGGVLLINPLTAQLQGVVDQLPTLVNASGGAWTQVEHFLAGFGVAVSITSLRDQLVGYLTSAGGSLLGGTLSVVTGLVTLATDIMLVLVIAFYLLLDGANMRNWALRFLPSRARERWFFIEATLNRVLGGYIRGQIIVALTVGVAAGLGCAVLGVQFPLVIGLLAFLFEFIPMVGPVLGMIPAVVIAAFQPLPLVLWVIIYFIVLQQVESNVIVPRVSGHAVGLHPLAALLALLAGVELGGLGGALIAVPIVGVLYVIALALYSDATSQSQLLAAPERPTAYRSLRQAIRRRGETIALPVEQPAVPNERLASIAEDQAQLKAQFEADVQTETAHAATSAAKAADAAAGAAAHAADAASAAADATGKTPPAPSAPTKPAPDARA
ncbi:MAG TPA: AI-2E family transporter [Chloroflexia bacterium]|nr:AI-2E family transporter [Chloroflexia bacterium]